MLTLSLYPVVPSPSTFFPDSPPRVKSHPRHTRRNPGLQQGSGGQSGKEAASAGETHRQRRTHGHGGKGTACMQTPPHMTVLAHPQPGTCLSAISFPLPPPPSPHVCSPQIRGCTNSAAPSRSLQITLIQAWKEKERSSHVHPIACIYLRWARGPGDRRGSSMPSRHTNIALRHTQTGCRLLDGGGRAQRAADPAARGSQEHAHTHSPSSNCTHATTLMQRAPEQPHKVKPRC